MAFNNLNRNIRNKRLLRYLNTIIISSEQGLRNNKI